jgi:predicted transcriptional regulator of viral defense system
MRTTEAFARLEGLHRPVVTTREAAVAWGQELPAATRTLTRLDESGLMRKLAHGVWQVGRTAVDPTFVLPVLTEPYPSYVSGWSALSKHGMIEQIPRATFVVTLDRSRTVATAIGEFEIHHLHPDLFGGFEGTTAIRAGVARPEKALFDTIYLLTIRNGHVTLPELELADDFDGEMLRQWAEAAPSARLRTMTMTNLGLAIDSAIANRVPDRGVG